MKGYTTIDAGCVNGPAASKPTISVIVPIYNTEQFLDQALSSIENQTLANIEILCINDGSTDKSRGIMQTHANHDSRIRIIDKPNGGYGAACNRGIAEAQGHWIAIVEPDDWIDSGMYRDMVDFANSFSEIIDIIKTPYTQIWLPDTPDELHLNCSFKPIVKPTKQPFAINDPGFVKILGHHPSIWSALYRKEFLDQNNIRFPEYPGAGWADNPFLIETLCKAKNIVYLPRAYYNYRENTPEQDAAFAQKQTLLPLERWLDMTDILDANNVTDENIRRVHNERGFLYLKNIVQEIDLSNQTVREAATAMFDRMDADLVFSDPRISPGWKKEFATIRGIEAPQLPTLPYMINLANKGLTNIINVGPKRTFQLVGNYVAKRIHRA